MTIVSVTENLEAASFNGYESHNEITRGWDVVTDGVETEDYDVIDALITNGNIPNAGGSYPDNTNYKARKATCTQLADTTQWLVVLTFDNRSVDYDTKEFNTREVGIDIDPTQSDDPTQDPYVINISEREESFPLFVDMNGHPILSTAVQELDPLPNGHFVNDVYEYTVNTTGPDDLRVANGTINSDHIYLVDDKASPTMQRYCPPLTALLKVRTEGPFVRRKSDGSSVKYWKNNLTIERKNVYIAKSVFDNGYLEIWRAVAPETWNQFDTEWANYSVDIQGTEYYQLPWGEYLANTSLWRLKSDAPSQYVGSTDYALGERVYYNPGGGIARYICIRENGPSTVVKAPQLGGGGGYWSLYATGQSGSRHERIKYKDIDTDSNTENAELPVETPQWLDYAGNIRLRDASPAEPYVYLWFRTHFSARWLSISSLPVTDASTTTTT